MTRFIGAIDQGTTSTRFIVFDREAASSRWRSASMRRSIRNRVGSSTRLSRSCATRMQSSLTALAKAKLTARDIQAVGITNQRETTVMWDRAHGRAAAQRAGVAGHACRSARCVLQREGGKDRFRAATGLPLASYFSGLKLRWLLDNVPDARARRQRGRLVVRHDRHLARCGTCSASISPTSRMPVARSS